MGKDKKKRDWYYRITKGMGIVVCTAALLLFLFLIRIILRHGLDVVLAIFLLTPILTFAAGCVFIKLSGLETEQPEARYVLWKGEEQVIKKIGILSDTHGMLRPEVIEILKGCDHIIHGGDIADPTLLETLRAIGPLSVVRGNNDKGPWADVLEPVIRLEICGIKFLAVHNRKDAPKHLTDVDVVVFGHSHKYYCEKEGDILWLNPGSCGRRRFGLPATMAVMEIRKSTFHIEQYILEEKG